ncbi:hypothetical protein CUMW_239760 [Citrus unshiu]|uniref:Ubiquitin-like protease family profile domain-containing protein n=1 Tax=Citrus unshiu TaxID=55188 RepID=A0A2H5QKV4_CITUN|nr:hypothetical protein CUMW_239760 [Citrus unshiu]
MVYDSFDNALFEKDEKFKTTWLKNLDHNIEKYNLYGFTSGVQAWIYEAIGGLPSTWVVKTKKKIPRIVQWKPMASSKINFAEVYSFFNDESRLGDVLQTLEPISKESNRKYWLTVFLNQLWNNEDCAVDSLVFDDCLNCYLCGRQHTMSKSMTDVDMLLILVNLDGEHWVLARVDFRKNKVWIYDSLLTFHDDKRYKLKFKPLEVIFPRWLEYVGFYNIHLSCGVPTLGKLSQLRARHNKSPELAIAVFLY